MKAIHPILKIVYEQCGEIHHQQYEGIRNYRKKRVGAAWSTELITSIYKYDINLTTKTTKTTTNGYSHNSKKLLVDVKTTSCSGSVAGEQSIIMEPVE